MSKFRILSLIFLIVGIAFFSLGFLYGDVQAGVFVIFPFVAGSGLYAFIGFIFIFIAILLFIFGFPTTIESNDFRSDEQVNTIKKTSIKGGGVVLIGPIPIVFGSNWKIAVILMILSIILILVAFFAFSLI